MTTNPDGKPYAHNVEQAEAHKRALAEGDGPVSNETARAYLRAYPAEGAVKDALELVRIGPRRSANAKEWMAAAAAMCGKCHGSEDVNEAASRILATEYLRMANALKEEKESNEVGRVVDAMTAEQVDAYLGAHLGLNLDELRADAEQRSFGRMVLPTTRPTHADIAWYVRELTEAKAREEKMLDALRLVAKHADFSQCPDGVEEAVDAALLPPNSVSPTAGK